MYSVLLFDRVSASQILRLMLHFLLQRAHITRKIQSIIFLITFY